MKITQQQFEFLDLPTFKEQYQFENRDGGCESYSRQEDDAPRSILCEEYI